MTIIPIKPRKRDRRLFFFSCRFSLQKAKKQKSKKQKAKSKKQKAKKQKAKSKKQNAKSKKPEAQSQKPKAKNKKQKAKSKKQEAKSKKQKAKSKKQKAKSKKQKQKAKSKKQKAKKQKSKKHRGRVVAGKLGSAEGPRAPASSISRLGRESADPPTSDFCSSNRLRISQRINLRIEVRILSDNLQFKSTAENLQFK